MKRLASFIVALGIFTLVAGSTHNSPVGQELAFMRGFMGRVNPAIMIEDQGCAFGLPQAILKTATSTRLDWIDIFTLAWQESDFDCHAKNKKDRGGAFGPYQIRRLWQPVVGDPRYRYYDPSLATHRVGIVLTYFRDTPRFSQLVERGFKNPLLCLYNSGEPNRVNMRYCRDVGRKARLIRDAWERFQALPQGDFQVVVQR